MKIGIVGLPQSGKTSLFTALAGDAVRREELPHQKFVTHLGTIKLEDERLLHLGKIFASKKITFVEIVLLDLLLRGERDREWFEASSFHESDCLLGVIRCFNNTAALGDRHEPDPLRDIKIIEDELIVRDKESVFSRIAKIEQEIKKGKKERLKELEILKKINGELDKQKPLREVEMDSFAERLIRGFKFFTQKPLFFILNLDEQLSLVNIPELKEKLARHNYKFLRASLKFEAELRELEEAEQGAFLETVGFKEPLKKRFQNKCLDFFGLVTFFTVKGKEARAWLIDSRTSALKAAGKIHSDIEHGFIRAEVINYKDFVSANSSLSQARKMGMVRLEPKEYIVRDGDIIDFRFNV